MRNMEQRRRRIALLLAVLAIGVFCPAFGAGKVELYLPLARNAYQTNESIHFAVVRSAPAALAAGEMALTVTGSDGDDVEVTAWLWKAISSGSRAGLEQEK